MIRLTVLAGSQQGRSLDLRKNKVRIGHSLESDLVFDVEVDPEIAGQQITLFMRGDRWFVDNECIHPLFVNQSLVMDSSGLRSGDVLRMSHDGPDILFELILVADQHQEPASTPSEKPRSRAKDVTPAVVVPSRSMGRDSDDVSQRQEVIEPTLGAISVITQAPLGQGANRAVSGEAMFKKNHRKSGMHGQASASPRHGLLPKQQVSPKGSQETGVVLVALIGCTLLLVGLVVSYFIFSADSEVELASGVAQSNRSVTSLDESESSSAFQDLQKSDGLSLVENDEQVMPETRRERNAVGHVVESTGSVGTVEPGFSRKQVPELLSVVDLDVNSRLLVDLGEELQLDSSQDLTFVLDEAAPRDIQLDSRSGMLSWDLKRWHEGLYKKIGYRVLGSGEELIKGDVAVSVQSTGLAARVFRQSRNSIFLVAAHMPSENDYLPLGVAYLVDQRSLMTSAYVATAIMDVRSKGLTLVVCPLSEVEDAEVSWTDVVDASVHRIYQDASEKSDREVRVLTQAFFDLGILSVASDLAPLGALVTRESDLPKSVACVVIGYSVDGVPLQKLEHVELVVEGVDIIASIPPPNTGSGEGRPPYLLQLEGDLPPNLFGGLVLDENAKVLGVYAFEADSQNTNSSTGIHYAAETVPVQAWLSGYGVQQWVMLGEDGAGG